MDVEGRKKAAVEFLRAAAAGDVRRAAERYLAPGGVHHNMYFPAGWEPLLSAMEAAAKEAPRTALTVKHVLGDGDLVAVHSHVVHRPGERGIAVVHLFRFEGERVAELWDIGVEIPADSPNQDGAF